jgi:hypothetical protein
VREFKPRLRVTQDLSPADWLHDRVIGLGVAASSVPIGFDAYAQVLHPAGGPGAAQVRWTDAAESVGVSLLPGTWFQDLEEIADADDRRARGWEQAPKVGTIPDNVLEGLRPVLGRHTASYHGWFCLWEGWGTFTGSMTSMIAWPADHPPSPDAPHHYRALLAFAPDISDGPKVKLPNRAYLLFEGQGFRRSWAHANDL